VQEVNKERRESTFGVAVKLTAFEMSVFGASWPSYAGDALNVFPSDRSRLPAKNRGSRDDLSLGLCNSVIQVA
jgi:hypothetical protein